MRPVRPRWQHALYVVTDPRGPRGLEPYLEALAAPDLAGRWALQLRDHDAPDDELRAALGLLVPRARDAGVPVLLGAASLARVRLARDEGASGVHLPERGPGTEDVRAVLGDAWIGASVHDPDGLARRGAQVDVVVAGPIRPVADKGVPLTHEQLSEITRRFGGAVLALGGVRTRQDVAWARGAGCAGVAVREAVTRARAGQDAVRALLGWLDQNETAPCDLGKLPA